MSAGGGSAGGTFDGSAERLRGKHIRTLEALQSLVKDNDELKRRLAACVAAAAAAAAAPRAAPRATRRKTSFSWPATDPSFCALVR